MQGSGFGVCVGDVRGARVGAYVVTPPEGESESEREESERERDSERERWSVRCNAAGPLRFVADQRQAVVCHLHTDLTRARI